VLADPHAREVAAAGRVGDPGAADEKSFAAWATVSSGSVDFSLGAENVKS
jgi:hypothetical protein